MRAGFRGTFVISWSQTELDGLSAAPLHALDVGAAWSWRGEPVRVDGSSALLQLDHTEGETDTRRRAARMVRRLVGAAISGTRRLDQVEVGHPLSDASFVVTDGSQSYTVTLIEVGGDAPPLLMFLDELPPRNTELWVVHHTLSPVNETVMHSGSGGVICFTPGTRIRTPDGDRPVEELREGDRVLTKDDGAQEILWTGGRRMTGARLYAMPELRPIRISTGALGIERPDQEFLVSPQHRMLVRGRTALALFNTPEVLVAAKDMVNGSTIRVDTNVREVLYIHLLLDRHQVLWANGVETESFHPASASLASLSDEDRARLTGQFPDLVEDPILYGAYARRTLSSSEAAILMHEAA